MVDTPGDRISIHGIVVSTIVGVLPHEREIAQPIRVDLDLFVDLHDAGRSDELADTVNYGEVAVQVASAVRESKDVLLERLAGRAAEIAVGFGRVEAVDVTVTKLRPPVPENLEATSVTITRSAGDYDLTPLIEHTAIVALGSNLGDREGFLRLAVERLGDVTKMSRVYETDPVGGPGGQNAFLNMVVEVRTMLDPYAFLRRCRQIEADGMRQRTVRWGPRTLDVDVLFYEEITIDDPILTLPHPRYAERRFVLAPLSDIAPERCPAGWEADLPDDGVRARGPLPEA
ncbi:MAG: 2-amino-4-hydroxy-6-hydroxymethyldihydropteridine diphosphokinase [Acidimicrobiia bacterium]|nr:2-amino-4-hydroxy-6-hydroxymethyldihydropteridine diphosphokinase [Acidimicrobiia bacterium]